MKDETNRNDHRKIEEIEKLLQELKASDEERAVTVEGTMEQPKNHRRTIWQLVGVFFSLWRKSFLIVALLAILLIAALPFAAYYFITSGSTATEQSSVFLERIQELNEMATAEAYTKVIIERQDNELFGKSIGLNLPGTKRQLIVVVPGVIKAGVDLSNLDKDDIRVREAQKSVEMTLPKPKFLGGAEIFFDQVDVYSQSGVFRGEANIEEAYDLADEAKALIKKESTAQGVLDAAQQNAEQTVREMFALAGYDVSIEFKE